MTVSRVMNNPAQVAPETADRVRAAIDRLGYVPNLLAGGLSSRRSRIVAAIVPTIASPMFATSVQAFTDVLDQAGYHTVLGLSGYGKGSEDALLGAILGRRPDGLLLTGATRSAATRRRLATAGVPVVEIWDLADEPTDMIVGFDHRAVGAAVAAFFLARGYRRFAVIAADDPRASARREGYAAALPPGALVFDSRLPAPAAIQGGRDALAKLPLAAEPTALFCSSDLPAAGAVIEAGAARHRHSWPTRGLRLRRFRDRPGAAPGDHHRQRGWRGDRPRRRARAAAAAGRALAAAHHRRAVPHHRTRNY